MLLLCYLRQEGAAAAPASEAPADEAGLTTLLLARGDEADPELVRRLANLKTLAAADGLARFYDALSSLYMRRIALHGFALFDGVPEAEASALQKLTDIATLSIEPELRDSAVDELAGCNGGRLYLAAIVNSPTDDEVRERALRQHVANARAEDGEWYLKIYRSAEGKEKDKKKDKKPERDKGDGKDKSAGEVLFTPPLRELAFEGMVASRSSAELVEATESKLVPVRRRALEELAARRDPKTGACAEQLFEKRSERPDVRLLAAQLLLEERGAKFADTLYKSARRGEVPLELAFGIADLLIGLDDAGLRAQAIKNLGDGQPPEKRFHLRMAARIPDPKVDKALLELGKDKDPTVAADALRAMGVRGNPTFVPRLQETLEESRNPLVLAAVIDSLILIRGSDEAWRVQLVKLATNPMEVVRNSALEALGRTKDASYLPTVLAALEHPSWTTRLAAAKALAELRLAPGVGALCERIGKEEGRMVSELADILWQLTAQPFRSDKAQWKRWWDKEAADFRFPTAEELAKRLQERNLREEKQVSKSFRGVKVDSRFFGLRILSHHVAFVVDISGSMEEKLPTGQRTEQVPTRIEVARKELLACLEALEAGTRFNILPFSNGATPWKEAAVECTEATFNEAKEFVAALGAFGGTNIYDGLHQAFLDETVDTIFFLSDGEPSVGEVVDPLGIREAVQGWNKERGVVIHTISIGDRFPLLEWLATDNGGSYRTYP
ncbi:MAG: VWA domain-containing protein [Planctomycetes bacterium]|nr:VWA domain-containing protein [Planctomycetota bacterium]